MTKPKRFRLITFDVYTALFDIEGSLTPLVHEALDTDAMAFVRAWRRKQLELALISNSLGGGRPPFDLLTQRALDDTLARTSLELSASGRAVLLQKWLALEPWPEAINVLTQLKARGRTLALLSNGDLSQLEALARRLPPVFGDIFSSEQAGYYKPHPDVYALPLKAGRLQPHEVLHVAGSPTDALGTKAAGLRCAWSNRHAEPLLDPERPVDYNLPDLRPLLDIL